MGWLVRQSLEPTKTFKIHFGKTLSFTIIDIHLTCDIWCIIGSLINKYFFQNWFFAKWVWSDRQAVSKIFLKIFQTKFYKYSTNISQLFPQHNWENCTFAKYFQPWRPVVSQNSENIMITHLLLNYELSQY